MWKCPECQSERLLVAVETTCKLVQYPEEDDFQTEPIGYDEWGEDSHMTCRDCGHSGPAGDFDEDRPGVEPPKPGSYRHFVASIRQSLEPCDHHYLVKLGNDKGDYSVWLSIDAKKLAEITKILERENVFEGD